MSEAQAWKNEHFLINFSLFYAISPHKRMKYYQILRDSPVPATLVHELPFYICFNYYYQAPTYPLRLSLFYLKKIIREKAFNQPTENPGSQ